ncbi:uncharacterized protein BDZ99DRAFT_197524 [Mytilinidion resinicola]|uniref:Uncharacterized protein n=1 Tax=Mytilinidion resinicola TaxID=574789 RepID=A0A6A6Z325_9PEZI|nr:uncharacterized protein BDZ99DRAFT_197524 [Mytilinidion resinicola]KAF2815506.1 hypothetical protein BDZ99DRAFT_197524 [Mytilinidion resinicola]
MEETRGSSQKKRAGAPKRGEEVQANNDEAPDDEAKFNGKLLMVSQVWLWQVDSKQLNYGRIHDSNARLVASPDPWTEAEGTSLFDKLHSLWFQNQEESIENFVWQVLHQCINSSDEPVYRGPGGSETWASIFAKSIAARRLEETRRYTEFSEYIRDASKRSSLKQSKSEEERKRELKALYDISPETEELRQTRDIRNELEMIGRVFDTQDAVFKDWGKRKAKEDPDRTKKAKEDHDRTQKADPDWIQTADPDRVQKADPDRYQRADPDFAGKREGLKKLDEEAQRIEKRVSRPLHAKLRLLLMQSSSTSSSISSKSKVV